MDGSQVIQGDPVFVKVVLPGQESQAQLVEMGQGRGVHNLLAVLQSVANLDFFWEAFFFPCKSFRFRGRQFLLAHLILDSFHCECVFREISLATGRGTSRQFRGQSRHFRFTIAADNLPNCDLPRVLEFWF